MEDNERERTSWEAELLAAGVPRPFLEALRSLRNNKAATVWDWLPLELLGSATADLYQQDTSGFGPWLAGKHALPIFAESNNDVFVLLVIEERGQRRFVRVGAEEGVMDDFGPDFRTVLADLVIQVWEADTPPADVRKFAESIGFNEWRCLIEELERADRSSVERDSEFRSTVLPRILTVTTR